MNAGFLQIHTLTNFPASLLNRDDAGFAKRIPFGGTIRTRISSQCLKRHWRTYEGVNSLKELEVPDSVRSRRSFEKFVFEPLVSEGVDEELARSAVLKLIGKLFGSEDKQKRQAVSGAADDKSKASQKRGKASSAESVAENKEIETSQITVLGKPELNYLLNITRAVISESDGSTKDVEDRFDKIFKDKALAANLRAIPLAAGIGAALFGRMITGDILSRTDSCIHVAHAMTVHEQATESDYFSAIDDIVQEKGEQGSAHINATELTSGLFYGYVVVDIEGLISNLGGDVELASEVVKRLVHMIPTVSPGAKLGSTAPYAYSHIILAEFGRDQPRTLANAFVDAISTRGDLLKNAYQKLGQHLNDLDDMYGKPEFRAHAGIQTAEYFENRMPIRALAEWCRDRVLV
jgi:CRISPR system Cascade subunit CasC